MRGERTVAVPRPGGGPTRRAAPRRRGARAWAAVFGALALLAPVAPPPSPARAQTVDAIVVVDMRRALAEVDVARALRSRELEERRAVRAALDRLKAELEAEEAALVELRETLPKDAFEQRVRAFDQRVRAERRGAQREAAAIEERYAVAARALEAVARRALDALVAERGAQIAFDRSAVLSIREAQDLTDALVARIDEAYPAQAVGELLPPGPASPP